MEQGQVMLMKFSTQLLTIAAIAFLWHNDTYNLSSGCVHPEIRPSLSLFIFWHVSPGLFFVYYCIGLLFFKLSVSFIVSLEKCHRSAFNALINFLQPMIQRLSLLLKTMWEKEKLLVKSNFSFSHSVFFQFGVLSAIFIKFKIVVCKLFQFGKV